MDPDGRTGIEAVLVAPKPIPIPAAPPALAVAAAGAGGYSLGRIIGRSAIVPGDTVDEFYTDVFDHVLHTVFRKRGTQPGPQAQPEQGKRDKEKIDRARGRKEKPVDDSGQFGDPADTLDTGQPGANKPEPSQDARPKSKIKAGIKGLIDVIADVFEPSGGSSDR